MVIAWLISDLRQPERTNERAESARRIFFIVRLPGEGEAGENAIHGFHARAIRVDESIAGEEASDLKVGGEAAAALESPIGFWRKSDDGKKIYSVKTTVFSGWFERDADVRGVLRWLHDKGYLVVRKDLVVIPEKLNVELATKHEKLNRDGLRCIRFRDPRALLASELAKAKASA